VIATRIELAPGALGDPAALLPEHGDAFLLTDDHVEPLLPTELLRLPHLVLPPGETSKSWEQLGAILLALDEARIDRDGHLLAVGGGVVTDIGGLAASLHRRGIAWTAVPTTLIGQVDAAIGGKTAVDLGGGKNTVGSFHPPERVIVDPGALASLPARELRAGMAEVLKSALVAGPDLLDTVEQLGPEDFAAGTPPALEAIMACVRTKERLVAEDLHDHGVRRHLNLGHTFGHAFEALAAPALVHGEAVGLGLLCAARLAGMREDGDPALEERLRALLLSWGLPVTTVAAPHRVLAEMGRDKKRRQGRQVFVLALAPGRIEVIEDPDPTAVTAALQAVGQAASTS
jgi:3-dehydroquinate synthetase